MSVVEHLHDDELLDRARSGTLTTELHERLKSHCDECDACAMEVRWIEDGLHRLVPTDDDRSAGLRAVEAVLGGRSMLDLVGADDARLDRAVEPARPRTRRGTFRWMIQVAAGLALCLVSTGALAAVWSGVERFREIWIRAEASMSEASPGERPPVRSLPRRRPALRDQADPPPEPPPRVPAEVTSRHVSSHAPRPVTTQARSPAPEAVPSRAARAEQWLRLANQARTRGDYPGALARYRSLERRFPSTRAGQVAILSAARLLQHQLGDAVGALAVYRRYIALPSSPPLLEEARLGVAQCARSLADPASERRAWQDLIDHHAGSLHTHQARERLSILDADPHRATAGAATE